MSKKDPFDILYGKLLYGKLMGSSRDRSGEIFMLTSRTYARREMWPMHARLDEIVFLALGTRWRLSIDPEDNTAGFDYSYRDLRRKQCMCSEMLGPSDMPNNWAKMSLEEFLLQVWRPLDGTTTPSGVPWEIAMILDPVAQEIALASYLKSKS